ncbi:MAG: T9SS type A sorting domain-containing protein [Bacteroidota bacterium]
MKKFTLLTIVLIFALFSYTKAQVTVTINVDMSDVVDFDPSTRQVDFAGDFDGWAAFHPLTNSSGNIYSVTFTDVTPGYYGGDVYHNAKDVPDWGTYGEWSGAPTGIDIMTYVGNEDVTMNTKWGATYSITCSVDMNEVTEFNPATDNVYYINEDIDPLNETAMTDDNADGIYTVTFNDIPEGHFPTVFAYGVDVDNLTYEWEYASNKGLRVLLVEGANIDETFTFGETTGEIQEGVDVTINLDMRGTDFDEATEVLHISGDFNGWTAPGDDTKYKFTKSGEGTYILTLTGVAPGYYLDDIYRDVAGSESWGANGEWSGGPTGIDVMILVGEENVTFNNEWGKTLDMTFRVDMNDVTDFDAATDTVYYINEGVGALHMTEMTDDDADGIYVVTFEGVPQGHYPTVFAYGSSSADDLSYEWSWVELATRVITLEDAAIDKTYIFGTAEGVTTGIFDNIISESGDISIYPNPVTNGIINIRTQNFNENSIIKILNIQGKEVVNAKFQKQSTNVLDVSSLKTGIYIVNVMDGGKISNTKLIIK